jgi:gamma-glutamylcyclotransferase (GGCT)/AIG2-like uncharacterized protein YtfP
MTFDYFAYGSNLHPWRLAERTPSCRIIGAASLVGFQLRFHKRSLAPADASGKCDAYATGRAADVIHGAIYRIHRSELPALDAAEGRGCGYERITARVELHRARRSMDVQLYVAQAEWSEPTLAPYEWYLELVVSGARHHGLPEAYRTRLAGTPALPDPDAERAARHFRLARRAATG